MTKKIFTLLWLMAFGVLSFQKFTVAQISDQKNFNQTKKLTYEKTYQNLKKQYKEKLATKVPIFIKALSSKEKNERIQAAIYLGKSCSEKGVEILTQHLINDSVNEVRAQCAKSLGYIESKKAIPSLIKSLNDPEEKVRIESAISLALLDEKQHCLEILAHELYNKNRNIRMDVLKGLKNVGNSNAISLMKAALNDVDLYVRADAAILLTEIEENEISFPTLRRLINHQDKYIRLAALRGLKNIANNEAIYLIIKRLKDKDSHVRRRARKFLKYLDINIEQFNNIFPFKNKMSYTNTYDPEAAANYAETWWDGHNDATYINYEPYDCANFVSQCLIAGGMNLSAGPGVDDCGCIYNCNNLHLNLIYTQGATYEKRNRFVSGHNEPLWFVKGDPINFNDTSVTPHHSMICVIGDDQNYAKLDAHSAAAHKVEVSDVFSASGNDWMESCYYYHIPNELPNPPNPPTIISPGSNSEPGPQIETLTPTLQWEEVSNADYYALAISVYPYGSNNIVYNPQQLYGSSHNVPEGILENDKKYRWNMQAHNSSGWSSVSNALYFQTPISIQPPTLISPSNGSHQTCNINFQWNSVSDATNYKIYIKAPSWTNFTSDNTTSTNYTYPPGEKGEFRWKVKAYVNGTWSDYSEEWSFYFDGVDAPTLKSPSNHEEITSLNPYLEWYDVSCASYYKIEVATDNSFNNVVAIDLNVYETSWQLNDSDIDYGNTYYWHVASSSPIGNWSDSWCFTIKESETITTPDQPTGPSTGKVGQSLNFTTGGAESNLGHSVEYRFNWGDGNYSNWGSVNQSHTYTNVGSYIVKARARCQTHTSVLSNWSSGENVDISGHTLSISITGSGTVSKSPDKSEYNHNENVTLTANPSSGWEFDHWEGDLSGSDNPETISMNSDKNVQAVFIQTPETITTPNQPTGPSTGKVAQTLTFSTGGAESNLGHSVEYRFNWGDGNYSNWGPSSQSYTYMNVGTYTVKAQARCQTHTDKTSNWSSEKNVNISGHTLRISITGSGNVNKSPDKNEYNHNESVTLTANASSGWEFDHWEGDVSGSDSIITITLNENKNITANFIEITYVNNNSNSPKEYNMFQNYPNPFNSETIIRYQISQRTHVIIAIFNPSGQKIKILYYGEKQPGTYTTTWDGKDSFSNDVTSGIYFYQIKTEKFIKTMKMILIR